MKPVIQEIREIIQPYRRLIQQIQPVIEQTHTVIAKGEPRPPVQPISVTGASGSLNSGGTNGGLGLSGGSIGSKSLGSSGNYAASASSVSLKSAQPSSSSSDSSYLRPIIQPTSASSSLQQLTSSTPINNANSGRKFVSIQQIFQQQHQQSPSSSYSARKGEFREPVQTTQTKIRLRPAPINPHTAYQRASVQLSQLASQLNPIYQPYPYFDYKGAVSELNEEDLPLLTFVAKPHRFRARA